MRKIIFLFLLISSMTLVVGAADVTNMFFSDGQSTINGTDICTNITGDSICLSTAAGGSGDITAVNTNGQYLLGGASSGGVNLLVNDTFLNLTIDDRAASVGDTNCSIAGSCSTVVYTDNESILDVNRSDYWDEFNDVNITQFENNAGSLQIIISWLVGVINGEMTNIFDQSLNTTDNVTFAEVNSSNWGNVTITESQVTDLIHTTDTNASTICSDGQYLNGDGTCPSFNDSVTVLFEDQQVIYNASTIVTETGTLDSGNLASILELADGDTYNVSEVSGAPGFLININFTNVVAFNVVALRGRYEGGAGHSIAVELYRVGVGWEERAEITDQMDFGVTLMDVFIGSDFIDGDDTVQLRINHDDSGITSHDYFLDYAIVGQSSGIVSGGDLGDLTGRDDACELLPDVFCKDGSKNMTDNINVGGNNITNVNLVNATTFIGDGSELTGISGDDASWNESYADTLYAPLLYGDSWNKTYADTLYSWNSTGLIVNWSLLISGGDDASWNKTYADTLYVNITGDIMTGNLNMSTNNISMGGCTQSWNGTCQFTVCPTSTAIQC